jgi:hypothetical protein
MIEPKFKVGDIVKTKKKIRNDGTFQGYPGVSYFYQKALKEW